ncbi:hypothetical protein IQ231_11290 [Cuspidothrix issatschenkoi LEGE 03284]|uniref:hypothetical protein n=1 Tax=Cuspidothrix issatschenkoi TaxID=230752 RepID=UPI001881174E|nr:hypothetical protein [Cuspidothrix issatschenkoi]MBE9232247.1 hypothetical protein [Cuspidothrix issatschenkoi LEGE 03284]
MARVKLNDTERTAFKEVYKYECYICQKKKEPNELEIDHIIPPNKKQPLKHQDINSDPPKKVQIGKAPVFKLNINRKFDLILN